MGQPEFNTFGKFGGKYGFDIFKVYDKVNLEGLGKPKTEAKKRYEMHQVLKGFQAKGVIGRLDKRLLANDRLKFLAKQRIKNPSL